MPEATRHRGQATGDSSLGWPVAELAEDEEGLVACLHRRVEVAALPMSQRQRGEDMPVRQRIARLDRDGQRALERRTGRGHLAFVGQQRTEVEQRRARFPLDPRVFESGEGRFEEAAGGGEVVGGGCNRAPTTQGPALAERVAQSGEERLGFLEDLGAQGEFGDPVGEVPPPQERRGTQRRRRRRGWPGRLDQPAEPVKTLRRVAAEPVVRQGNRDLEPTGHSQAIDRRCGQHPEDGPDVGHLPVKQAQRVAPVGRRELAGKLL